jgi:hypothetical protein
MDDKKRPTDPNDKPVQGRVKKPKMAQKKQIQFTEDTDGIVRLMARIGMAYTRENYLAVNFLGDVPDVIDPEIISMLPDDLKPDEWRDPDDWEEIE